jgi:cytochrome P450
MLFYLAKDPKVQQLLREEVKDAMSPDSPPNWPKLTQLPLLDGILQETLRMHPPVPTGMPRNTPTTGAQIGDLFVPSDVIVSVPTWSIQRDERYFEKPNEWIPERWFSKPDLIRDRRAQIPFSIGPFNCAGKYFAIMEAKVFIAKVVTAFDIGFAPGEDGTSLLTNNKDWLTMWLPDLRLVLAPREKE